MQRQPRSTGGERPRAGLAARLVGGGLLALLLAACAGTPTTVPPTTEPPTATVAVAPSAAPSIAPSVPPAPTATKPPPTATPPRPTATARPTLAPTRVPTASGAVETPIALSPPAFERVGLDGEAFRILTAVTAKDGSTTLYAGGKGLWHSADGGKAWNVKLDVDQAPVVSAVAVAPSDPKTIYVGVGEGCGKGKPAPGFVTTDGGETWKKIATGITSLLVDPQDPRKVHLTDCTGVRLSEDGGATWTPLASTEISDYTPVLIAAAPSNGAVMYVVSAGEGGAIKVIRTTDSGKTWQAISPAKEVTGPIALTIDLRNPDTATLSTTVGLHRTVNGGQAWAPMTEGGLDQLIPARAPAGSPDGFRLNTILLISPDETGKYWLGTGVGKAKGIGLLRTRDNGESWKRVNGGLEGRQIGAMALGGTAKERVLYVATDDGIWALAAP